MEKKQFMEKKQLTVLLMVFLISFSIFSLGCVCKQFFDEYLNDFNFSDFSNKTTPDQPSNATTLPPSGNASNATIIPANTTQDDTAIDHTDDTGNQNNITQQQGIPTTDDEILLWLSTDAQFEQADEIENITNKNFECSDDTILKYEHLKDATYGIWETKYATCGDNKKARVLFTSLGLKESDTGNNDWEYVSHNETRGIYEFENKKTNIKLLYLVSKWPEAYSARYDEASKFKNYFASTICRLPECFSGTLTRNDVKTMTINGYDTYVLHNSDWTGIESAFFATSCQTGRCHDYGTTYIYISISGTDSTEVLNIMKSITNNILITQ
jgi:hypothetical protein